jgi:hypothetical protein
MSERDHPELVAERISSWILGDRPHNSSVVCSPDGTVPARSSSAGRFCADARARKTGSPTT